MADHRALEPRHPTGIGFWRAVYATAGSDDKCAACVGLGADVAINYRDEDFVEIMKGRWRCEPHPRYGGRRLYPRNIKALADDGRLVHIAFLQGPKAELNFAQIMARRLTVTGSTLRPQSDLAKARIARDLIEAVWPLIAAGKLRPVMDSTFPLAEAAIAHARMEGHPHRENRA